MATIAAGNHVEVYVPLAGDITITPGTGGYVEFGCSSPSGESAPEGRRLYAAAAIAIPAGSTMFLRAEGEDATYTDPATGGGVVTAYTAAQLSALAAAGGLTPYATYVASDTLQRSHAISASALAPDHATVSRRICFFGDSITQAALGKMGMNSTATSGSLTSSFGVLFGDIECNGDGTANRDGTLTYDSTTNTLTWQAPSGNVNNGDTVGAPVDASRTGFLYVPSGTAGKGLWLVWYGASRPYTSGTVTVTMAYNGFQAWAYSALGFPIMSVMAAGGRYTLAAMPSSAPEYAAGIYGLGGCTSGELLDAGEQIAQIASDIDVIQIGTNDFSGSVTVAEYLSNVQALIDARLASGTSLVIWTTILPRDTDTAAQRAKKAAAAAGMRAYALLRAGQVTVYDFAAAVTDPTNGDWASGYSADGIHPRTIGTARIAASFGPYLAALAPAADNRQSTVADAYDATNNPTGNLISTLGYAQMAGSAGTLGTGAANVAAWAGTTAYAAGQPVLANGNLYVCVTAGTSGSTAPWAQTGTIVDGTVTWLFIAPSATAGVATGWTASRSTGTTLAVHCAKLTRSDGVPGDWQALCCYVTGGAGTEVGRLQLTLTISTGVAAAMRPELRGECVLAASNNLRLLDLYDGGNGYTARTLQALGAAGSDAWPTSNVPLPLTLRSAPGYTSPASITSIQSNVRIQFATTGWAVVLIGRLGVHRLA